MYLSHLSLTMPEGGEAVARMFYASQLGLRELQRPECEDLKSGIWFDVGGLVLQLSVEVERMEADKLRHFGLGCGNVEALKSRLKAAGVEIEDGPPGPWKCFFTKDPFGNRIEIHAPGRSSPRVKSPGC